MKKYVWIISVAILALFLFSCGPVARPITSINAFLVEVTASSVDQDVKNLFTSCENYTTPAVKMLFYNLDNPPTGFSEREGLFSNGMASDNSVYALNQYKGQCGTTIFAVSDLEDYSATDPRNYTPTADLTFYLKPNDPFGLSYTMVVDDKAKSKVVITKYVLAEFEVKDDVYSVTEVQVVSDISNLTLLTNITDLSKGYALFRTDNDIVVDCEVIVPR
ncbi:MAG: hypothetical protein DRP33_04385 [Thermotogae bacterium]|nr:MAG: hypothetical protein DRP33_04385 [Thermotogota bacterium]